MLATDAARANLLTNGGFEIWQRGNGPFTANGAWSADRWQMQILGTDTLSVSRNAAGNTDIGSTYCAGGTATVGTGGGQTALYQILRLSEVPLKSREVTASVRVWANTANAVRIRLSADGTGAPSVFSAFHVGNSAYATLTATITVPADAPYVILGGFFLATPLPLSTT